MADMADMAVDSVASQPEVEWIRLISTEDCAGMYVMRWALQPAIACADVDVQVSNSSVQIACLASDAVKNCEYSLPPKVNVEDAVVKWRRRVHELWLSLPLSGQEDDDERLEQAEVVQSNDEAVDYDEASSDSNVMNDERLPGGMLPTDLWKLSGKLESVSWYKICPVAQVPVLSIGDDSKDSGSGITAKLRNSFLDICSNSSPKCQRRSHSEDSRHKNHGDLPFPQYVHTFHFRRGEGCWEASKRSMPQVVKSADSADAWLDMTKRTKMRAEAQPFTPAGMPEPLSPPGSDGAQSQPCTLASITEPVSSSDHNPKHAGVSTGVSTGPNPVSLQPVLSTCEPVPVPMVIPWSASCQGQHVGQAPLPAAPPAPPAPPPALPPVFSPAPAPRSPPPLAAPEVVPEAVALKPVPWGHVPYQLPLDKLIPESNSNSDFSTMEGSGSPNSLTSSTASVTGSEESVSATTRSFTDGTQVWRPSLRLRHPDEESNNAGELKNGEYEADSKNEPMMEVCICSEKFAQGAQKGFAWKPTLRAREEAAGLQKHESLDKNFAQALLDRPRYW